MSRLRIQVESIVNDGFDLELPRDGGASDRVVLDRVMRLHGGYEQDPAHVRLRRVAADALGLAQLAWHWEGGHVVVPTRAELLGVVLDLVIATTTQATARRLTGTVTVARAQLGALGIRHGDLQLSGAFGLTGLAMNEPDDASPALTSVTLLTGAGLQLAMDGTTALATSFDAGGVGVSRSGSQLDLTLIEVACAGVRVRAGDLELAVADLVARDVRIRWSPAGLELGLGSVELKGVEVGSGGGATQVRLEHLALPGGMRWAEGVLSVPELVLDAAHVETTLEAPAEDEVVVAAGSGPRHLDLRVLDGVSGRLDVDATADVRVPFLDRRVATHRFRIPITDGTIDFKELENDLSMLEDALLDFEVRRGKLVLEIKPPLLRFARKTLVDWELAPDQVDLAEQNRVHLRTLARPHVHLGDDDQGQGEAGLASGFELTRLELDPIDARLSLAGWGELALGDRGTIHLGATGHPRLAGRAASPGEPALGEPALGELRVTGAVHHRAEGAAARTELLVAAREARLGLDRLHVGGWVVSVDALALATLDEGVLALAGTTPTSARGVLRGVVLRGVRVVLPRAVRTAVPARHG